MFISCRIWNYQENIGGEVRFGFIYLFLIDSSKMTSIEEPLGTSDFLFKIMILDFKSKGTEGL